MCAGPVDNLIEDMTGVTAKKNAAKKAAAQAAEQQAAAQAAADAEATRIAELEASKQALIDAAATEQTNIQTSLGGELADIQQTNADLTNQILTHQTAVAGPTGPSASELAARGAAQTSQSVLQNEKKKKKNNLKLPYSPSKRQDGQRGPKSTKADLQIEGQTQSTGTGTNLAI